MIKNSTLLVITDGYCNEEPALIDLAEMASFASELEQLMQSIENHLPAPSARCLEAIRIAVLH